MKHFLRRLFLIIVILYTLETPKANGMSLFWPGKSLSTASDGNNFNSHNKPGTGIIIPCDGSAPVTKTCDDFCKSVKFSRGQCDLAQSLCACYMTKFGGIDPFVPMTVSSIYGISTDATKVQLQGGGLYEMQPPDLSKVSSSTTTSTTSA